MQFIDLKAQYEYLKDSIDCAIAGVLNHGQFIMGPEVSRLEKELRQYIGVKHCITCANGTDALQMLFMAYGIGRGDAVFCPDITFVASVEPAVMLGATPVFCDVTDDTYNLCPVSLERQIEAVHNEGKLIPKAVIVVDFLGNPANYKVLECICNKYGLIMIEDAAQSFGAEYHGKKCCSFGDSAITSFFPAKPLGCYGDGGAIFTNDDILAEICESIRVHGKGPKGKYNNVRVGMNSRLDTLQAAILLPKLKALREHEVAARQQIVERYNSAFREAFKVPFIAPDSISAYAQYALLAESTQHRDFIVNTLNRHEIPNMVYYPTPQHRLPVFASFEYYGEQFSNSINYCNRTFSLPMHPYLSECDQNRIIEAVMGARRNG